MKKEPKANKFKRKPMTPTKNAKPKKEKLGPLIEKVYEEEIEYTCPKRGLVKQKVKIQRFKTPSETSKPRIPSLNDLDELDDGLGIYGNDETHEEEMRKSKKGK